MRRTFPPGFALSASCNCNTAGPLLVIAFIVLSLSPPAWGITLWKVTNGQWDTNTNWTNSEPTLTEDARVANDGTAVISIEFGTAVARDLAIGYSTGDLLPPGTAVPNGTVTATNTNLQLGRDLFVGHVLGGGSTTGTLTTNSNVTVANNMLVGFHELADSPFFGSATGNGDIGGALSGGSSGGNLSVGLTRSARGGLGDLTVDTGVSGFANAYVGRVESGASGPGDGDLTINAAGLSLAGGAGGLFVGLSEGTGAADGLANITGPAGGIEDMSVAVVTAGGTATGSVAWTGATLTVIDDAAVGQVFGGGTANGTLTTGADLHIGDDIRFGRFASGSTGTATATVNVGGAFTSTTTGSTVLDVGRSNAGGSAVADLTVGAGMSGQREINIGLATSTGTAQADVVVTGGGMAGNSTLVGPPSFLGVGLSSGSGNALPSTLHVTGSVTGFRDITVGSTSSSGDATGELIVDAGSVTGTNVPFDQGILTVGSTSGSGNATGYAEIDSGASGFFHIRVGDVAPGATGTGVGDLIIESGGYTALTTGGNGLSVGSSSGPGTATGADPLKGATVDITGTVTVGNFVSVGTRNSGAGPAKGTLTIRDGMLIGGELDIGIRGTGTATIEQGISDSSVLVGWHSGGVGTLNVTSGGVAANSMSIGRNGGTGTATIQGGIDTRLIDVGLATADSEGPSQGTLTVLSGGITGNNLGQDPPTLTIGSTAGTDDIPLATANIAGSVTGFDNVTVGSAALSGNATASLVINPGALTGTGVDSTLLQVGHTSGSGTGRGSALIASGVSGYEDVRVGYVDPDAVGTAMGEVTISSGGLTGGPFFGDLMVGVTLGPGTATGPNPLKGATLDITGSVTGFASDIWVGVDDSPGKTGNARGTLTISKGMLADPDGQAIIQIKVGDHGIGTLSVDEGIRDLAGELFIGRGPGAVGTLSVAGGGVEATVGTPDAKIGVDGGTGTATIAGGFDITNGEVEVGRSSGLGELTVTDGDLSALQLTVGHDAGQGTATISGAASGLVNVSVGSSGGTGSLTVGDGVVGAGPAGVSVGFGGTGTAHVTGSITGFHDVNVGRTLSADNGDGTLMISVGNLSATTGGIEKLLVGHTTSSGSATGQVDVTQGSVFGFHLVDVGIAGGNFSDDATGSLTASFLTGDGPATLRVGHNTGGNDSANLAQGDVTITGVITNFVSVQVGKAVDGGFADGSLAALVGGISGISQGDMEVGVNSGSQTATGSVAAANGIGGFINVSVGMTEATGDATGLLTADQFGLTGTDSGNLSVGVSHGFGDADGTVNVTGGGVNGFNQYNIGVATGAGTATGTLNVFDGLMTAQNLTVGTEVVQGTADGTVALNPSLVDVTQTLSIGPGGTIALTIKGLTRADGTGAPSQYSAIAAATAQLDGTLQLNLDPAFADDIAPGDQFVALTWDTNPAATNFDTITTNAPTTPGLSFTPTYNPTDLTLTATATPGDTNLDGLVTLEDLVILAANFNTTVTARDWRLANFNFDLTVDAADLQLMAPNFAGNPDTLTTFAAALGVALTQPTPEPASLCVFALVMTAITFTRPRRQTPIASTRPPARARVTAIAVHRISPAHDHPT